MAKKEFASLFATSFQLVTICHRVVSKVKSSRRAQPQREIKFPSRTLERRANILSEIQLHKITRPFSTIAAVAALSPNSSCENSRRNFTRSITSSSRSYQKSFLCHFTRLRFLFGFFMKSER